MSWVWACSLKNNRGGADNNEDTPSQRKTHQIIQVLNHLMWPHKIVADDTCTDKSTHRAQEKLCFVCIVSSSHFHYSLVVST